MRVRVEIPDQVARSLADDESGVAAWLQLAAQESYARQPTPNESKAAVDRMFDYIRTTTARATTEEILAWIREGRR